MKQIFADIHQTNFWNDDESVSGPGSNLEQTEVIRKELPTLFIKLGIKSVLDIPCGDFYWGELMEWPEHYIGADIVPKIVETTSNRMRGKKRYYHWLNLDITKDKLPKVDLIFCRDLLGHFSNRDVKLALKNIKASGAKYLLTTTFPDRENIADIKTGEWRPINLASFFGLGDPILVINEGCTQGEGKFVDKSLGLWELQDG